MNEPYSLKFQDDKLYIYTPVSYDVYRKKLVMTKEIFQECYKRWIEPQKSEDKE